MLPNTHPRTKPKACNIGLAQATGEYCVVYDAEDHPDPDQLKKAVAAFRSLDPATVCLQAKLAYHNPNVNLCSGLG